MTNQYRRARVFGLNMRLNPVTRDLTVGQITEVIHAYVQAQTADGKRQWVLRQHAERGFRNDPTMEVVEDSFSPPISSLQELSKKFEL